MPNELEDNRHKRRVARDGEIVSAPLFAMDALRAAVASASGALSTFDSAGHKPGFAQLTDAQMQAKVSCYDAYIRRVSTAWQNPPPVLATTTKTPGGAPAPVHATDRAEVYANYDKKLSERWRGAA